MSNPPFPEVLLHSAGKALLTQDILQVVEHGGHFVVNLPVAASVPGFCVILMRVDIQTRIIPLNSFG